jgi:3-oxoacyl-[acyl-carrier protein] reductase
MGNAQTLAVVTGAGAGLGRALAVALARQGFDVAVVARNADRLAETAHRVEQAGRRAFVGAGDITDWAFVDHFARTVVDGAGPPQVVVNNAGQFVTGSLVEQDPAGLSGMLKVATVGAAFVSKAFLPAMLDAGGGQIVNIVSAVAAPGATAHPRDTSTGYIVAKRALATFGQTLRLELRGRGIRVTNVYPVAFAGETDLDDPDEKVRALYGNRPVLTLRQVTDAILNLLPPHVPVVDEVVLGAEPL